MSLYTRLMKDLEKEDNLVETAKLLVGKAQPQIFETAERLGIPAIGKNLSDLKLEIVVKISQLKAEEKKKRETDSMVRIKGSDEHVLWDILSMLYEDKFVFTYDGSLGEIQLIMDNIFDLKQRLVELKIDEGIIYILHNGVLQDEWGNTIDKVDPFRQNVIK